MIIQPPPLSLSRISLTPTTSYIPHKTFYRRLRLARLGCANFKTKQQSTRAFFCTFNLTPRSHSTVTTQQQHTTRNTQNIELRFPLYDDSATFTNTTPFVTNKQRRRKAHSPTFIDRESRVSPFLCISLVLTFVHLTSRLFTLRFVVCSIYPFYTTRDIICYLCLAPSVHQRHHPFAPILLLLYSRCLRKEGRRADIKLQQQ